MICGVCPARMSCAAACKVQPYRIFFLFAAIDAITAIGLWLPNLLGLTTGSVAGVPLTIWHRDEVLLGMVPAVLAGFVLTALPRWTRALPVSPLVVLSLAGLWLAGRVAHAMPPDVDLRVAAQGIAFVFVATLVLIAAWQVVASRAWREIKVVLLLASFAIATGLPLIHSGVAANELATRFQLACVIALVAVFGGRLAPALTAAWLEERGQAAPEWRGRWLETTAALSLVVALCSWTVAPSSELAAAASAIAGIAQMARLASWQGWRVARFTSVFALHVAYSWIPAGFALHAFSVAWPSLIGQAAAIHAWALGVIGLMSIAVMASMIRRQSRTPFGGSAWMSASLACAAIAAPARIAAEIVSDGRHVWLAISVVGWVAAFVLFLIAFKGQLLRLSRR